MFQEKSCNLKLDKEFTQMAHVSMYNILMRCQCDEYDKVRKHDEARWNSTRDGQSENMQFYYFFVITQCNLSICQSVNLLIYQSINLSIYLSI